MSIELVLVPIAIAAVSAWKAKQSADEAGRQFIGVATRMRDERLLQGALADSGAAIHVDMQSLVAIWPQGQAVFRRNEDDIWSAHFEGDITVAEAEGLISSVDAAYGRRVQQEVLARLRSRAPEVGMSVESETIDEADTVTMVLNIEGSN